MTYSSPHEALKNVWGYDQFRPLQEDIINSALGKNDTLAILPTGGGKSICYQVPALCREGITIVISPLIALMKDQVDQLRRRNVQAYSIHSGMTTREIDITLDNCVLGHAKLLYVSPERLKTELFIERAKRMSINLLAVDEAHCISQWGYDFRPSYQEIAAFRKYIPDVNVIALTASATPEVREDILKYLEFSSDHKVFVKSFSRPKLAYIVRKTEDKERQIIEILKTVRGSAVVYTRSRKRTKNIAAILIRSGLSADFYHAGLTSRERVVKQDRWMKNATRIMVATNAFGMGIDKPDVRLVIHLDFPDNVESYYQEAGRAGRDEKKAFAIILYQENDKDDLREKTSQSLVDPSTIRRTYQSLANYYKLAVGSNALESFDFDMDDFCSTYSIERLTAFNSIKKLGELGFIQLNESFYNPSKLIFNGEYEKIYKFQVENDRYEPIIRALLRIHGGELYSNFVSINEKKLATLLKINTGSVVKQLETLDQYEIVNYIKQKDSPQIVFLTARYDASRLPLDSTMLKARNEHELSQMESMIGYVENGKLCRSLYLQHYFGERNDHECGICDVCLEKKKRASEDKISSQIREKIFDILGKSSLTVNELSHRFPPHQRETVVKTVRRLLDSSQIRYDEVNHLHITGNA